MNQSNILKLYNIYLLQMIYHRKLEWYSLRKRYFVKRCFSKNVCFFSDPQHQPPRPPSPLQYCSQFLWKMCWTEWKINFPIYIFRVIVKVHRKLAVFNTKMTRTHKIKIGKIWSMIFLSVQHIPHLSLKREQNLWGEGAEGLHILSWEKASLLVTLVWFFFVT